LSTVKMHLTVPSGVGDREGEDVGDPVGESVGAPVGALVGDPVGAALGAALGAAVHGVGGPDDGLSVVQLLHLPRQRVPMPGKVHLLNDRRQKSGSRLQWQL
jgi:hypothetical protein